MEFVRHRGRVPRGLAGLTAVFCLAASQPGLFGDDATGLRRITTGQKPSPAAPAEADRSTTADSPRRSIDPHFSPLPRRIRPVSGTENDLQDVPVQRPPRPALNLQPELPPPVPGMEVPLPLPAAAAGRTHEIGGGERLKLIEFRQMPLVDAMQAFADQADINIVVSPEAAKTEVSVYLKNVTARQALDAITKAHGLYYKIDEQSGIVRISTTKEYRQTLADFQDEQTEVFTLLYPNPYVVALAIRNTFGDRVRLGIGDLQTDQEQIQDLEQRLQRFDLIESRNQGLGTFQNNLNNQNGFGNQFGQFGRGQFGQGGRGQFGNQFGLGGQLGQLGNQFGGFGNSFGSQGQQSNPANDTQRKPLENLSPDEIFLIEQARQAGEAAEGLSGLLERNRATIYVSVIRRNNQLVVRTGDDLIMRQIKELIQRLDVPTPLVLLEVKVLRVDLGDGFHSVFDYQFTDGAENAGTFSQGDFLGIPAKTVANVAVAGSTFGAGTALAASASDLTFQHVNESFRFRMQLLENKNRVTVVTSPILLTANNEVSRIFVGDTVPVTTSSNSASVTQPQDNLNGTGAITSTAPTTELQDIGQAMLITPNINADRTVTLRIAQEQSELRVNGGKIFVPVTNSTTNMLLGQTNSVTFETRPVDTVQRRQITGTIVAKDGLAVAIGGLISEGVQDNRDAVPVLLSRVEISKVRRG